MPRRVTKVGLALRKCQLCLRPTWLVVVQNVDEFIGRIRDHRTNMVEDLAAWKISTFKWRRLAMALAKNRSMLYVEPPALCEVMLARDTQHGRFFVLRGDESMFHRLRPSVVRYLGNMLTINTYLISIEYVQADMCIRGLGWPFDVEFALLRAVSRRKPSQTRGACTLHERCATTRRSHIWTLATTASAKIRSFRCANLFKKTRA